VRDSFNAKRKKRTAKGKDTALSLELPSSFRREVQEWSDDRGAAREVEKKAAEPLAIARRRPHRRRELRWSSRECTQARVIWGCGGRYRPRKKILRNRLAIDLGGRARYVPVVHRGERSEGGL